MVNRALALDDLLEPGWLEKSKPVHLQLRPNLPEDYVAKMHKVFAGGGRMTAIETKAEEFTGEQRRYLEGFVSGLAALPRLSQDLLGSTRAPLPYTNGDVGDEHLEAAYELGGTIAALISPDI